MFQLSFLMFSSRLETIKYIETIHYTCNNGCNHKGLYSNAINVLAFPLVNRNQDLRNCYTIIWPLCTMTKEVSVTYSIVWCNQPLQPKLTLIFLNVEIFFVVDVVIYLYKTKHFCDFMKLKRMYTILNTQY